MKRDIYIIALAVLAGFLGGLMSNRITYGEKVMAKQTDMEIVNADVIELVGDDGIATRILPGKIEIEGFQDVNITLDAKGLVFFGDSHMAKMTPDYLSITNHKNHKTSLIKPDKIEIYREIMFDVPQGGSNKTIWQAPQENN